MRPAKIGGAPESIAFVEFFTNTVRTCRISVIQNFKHFSGELFATNWAFHHFCHANFLLNFKIYRYYHIFKCL